MTLALALVSALVLTGPPSPKLDVKKVEAFAKRFFESRPRTKFEEWDEKKREAMWTEVAALPALQEGQLESAVDAFLRVGKKTVKRFKGDVFDTPFGKASFLRTASAAKGRGLILGLHGGGEGAGDAHECVIYDRKDCIGLYPQGIQLVHDTWNTVHGERFVLTLIEDAKLFDEIDVDRVYVTGFSMGGTGSWFFAGRHTDLFAAAAPGPGVFMASPKSQLERKEEVESIQHGFLPNVRNLPISFYIGFKDRNTMPGTYLFAWDILVKLRAEDPGGYEKIEFRTFPDLAHAFPEGEPKRGLDWLVAQRRDPYPKKLVWEYATSPFPLGLGSDAVQRLQKHRFYWLGCDDPQDAMQLVGTRDGNTFDVKVLRAAPKSIRILLNGSLIDPQQDVVVRVDGVEKYRGKPELDWRVLLRTLDDGLDPRLTFDREVRVDLR